MLFGVIDLTHPPTFITLFSLGVVVICAIAFGLGWLAKDWWKGYSFRRQLRLAQDQKERKRGENLDGVLGIKKEG